MGGFARDLRLIAAGYLRVVEPATSVLQCPSDKSGSSTIEGSHSAGSELSTFTGNNRDISPWFRHQETRCFQLVGATHLELRAIYLSRKNAVKPASRKTTRSESLAVTERFCVLLKSRVRLLLSSALLMSILPLFFLSSQSVAYDALRSLYLPALSSARTSASPSISQEAIKRSSFVIAHS